MTATTLGTQGLSLQAQKKAPFLSRGLTIWVQKAERAAGQMSGATKKAPGEN